MTVTEKQLFVREMLNSFKDYNSKQNLALDLNYNSYDSAVEDLQSRALDGTSQLNGLALIETLQNKQVLHEWSRIFPELTTYAKFIPLIGYNKIEQSIAIADKTKSTKLAEGVDSQKYNGGTTKVTMEADRYGWEIPQSNQLNMFNTMMAIQTEEVKNNIIEALREDFFNNLFANVANNLDTNNYIGGATHESVVYTQEIGKLTYKDLNNICVKLIEKYGEAAFSKYFISMSSDVYNALLSQYFDSGNVLWREMFNQTNMTFRGIPIILSDKIPDKTIAPGKNVIAFLTKDSIIAYGCNTIVRDDPYKNMGKDQATRYVQLRGRVRMCDPNINTIILQVRENTSQVSSKPYNLVQENSRQK